MTTIDFDFLNVYVKSKIPTNFYLKIVLIIFNFSAFIGLLWAATSFAVQDDKPSPVLFLLPIVYFFAIGKYFLWNSFGEEIYVISSTHISFQHNYGFWKTNLKTSKYNFVSIDNSDKEIKDDDLLHLIFVKYTPEKLQEHIFTTNISIKYSDWQRIFNRLNEMKIDEFGEEINFPKIYAN